MYASPLLQMLPPKSYLQLSAVHTDVGVVDFVRRGNTAIPIDGFAPPLSEVNPISIGRCEKCQALVLQKTLTPILYDGELPIEICPVCKSTPPSLHLLDASEPKGFFTDLEAEDFDGQFEWPTNCATR